MYMCMNFILSFSQDLTDFNDNPKIHEEVVVNRVQRHKNAMW